MQDPWQSEKSVAALSVPAFDQLQQHTTRTRRMHEDISMAAGSNFNFVRDQPDSISLKPLNNRSEIRDAQANVMQPLAAFGDELGNGRALRRCFQQLQAALSHRQHRNSHLFAFDHLLVGCSQPHLLVEALGRGQRFHRDSEMIDCESQYILHAHPTQLNSGSRTHSSETTSLPAATHHPPEPSSIPVPSQPSRTTQTSSCAPCEPRQSWLVAHALECVPSQFHQPRQPPTPPHKEA